MSQDATASAGPDVKIAASPINWHNDDFPILGALTSVDEILAGMQQAGFAGTELGSLFPSTAGEVLPILEHYELELAGGWFSAYLLTRDFRSERTRFTEFVKFLEQTGAKICTTAEASYCPFKPYPPSRYDQHFKSLSVPLFPYQLPTLKPEQWSTLGKQFDELTAIAAEHNILLGYHPHMQTVVQTAEHLAALAAASSQLHFTIDSGHLRFAGADPAKILEKYIDRTVHLHVKNVRDRVTQAAQSAPMSFEFAVVEGAFTVPGDGGIDFGPIFDVLKRHRYKGWLVVEAEQNPLTSDPVLYATLAREYIRGVAGW
jgi:inosose dehydratase